ncbi:MAG: DUF1015 domain-containing protein [Verrucomicrobiota bacterium]|nr:DUF1015 domain-containing protein [Verrucomicrobiota bacterium]
MKIAPFQGLRPKEGNAHLISAPPYDVVSRDEAFAIAKDNPLSLLHVSRAEIDLAPTVDPYSSVVYDTAVKNFKKLQDEGHLVRETSSVLYVYQQQVGSHTQRGVTAVVRVADYDADIIKKHEKTRQDKEDDRTRLTMAMRANAGPVFLTYRQNAEIDALVNKAASEAPLFDVTAPDGVRHTVWKVAAPADLTRAFEAIPCSYIADGHHRAASAARVGRELRSKNPRHDGTEPYNWFMAVLFAGNQLNILPYNRLIKDLNGHATAEFLKKLSTIATVTPTTIAKPTKSGQACLYLEGNWYLVELPIPVSSDPVSKLDVSVLQEKVLAPLLGIDDPRTSKRIDFVGGIRGTDYLVKAVDSGEAKLAWSLYPVTVDQLMDISDAGQIMPPKSTWFEPKLRSGFFMHTF